MTLVACPAGFGKSTLLAAWRERREPEAAWVTLDEGDDDPAALWEHVIAALGLAPPATSAPLREVVLPRLVNELAERGDAVLVLDDVHRVTNLETIAWFAEHMPAGVRLVLASRTDPQLPLGRLRARGQLLEVRADALRFTRPEASEFLNDRLELGLDARDIELLVARTEGWPAGLYLAALSLAGVQDKHALVAEFDGTSAHVGDFLAGEVLATHPPELQRFMLRTSVLERLCAPLCDAVLDEPGSAAALDELARTNLFLLGLDDRRRWFRFHHLFAQILRVELEKREPELVADLHRRAYEWHGAHGTTDEAIHHAIRAGAFDDASRLVTETWVQYANSGRIESINEWLAQMPDRDDQRLLLARAWVAALRGREGDMRVAASRARALGDLGDGPLPDGFVSVESSLSVLEATFGWGDVGAILANGERSERLEPRGSPWRPVITWALGWAHYCNGDLDRAERWLRETTEIAPVAEQWIVGVAAIADLSLIAGLRGRRAEQLRLAEEAVAVTRRVGLWDAVEDGEVHTAYGVALAAHGRHDDALSSLEKGVFLRRLWAQKLDLIDGLIALASTVSEVGDHERATALFDEAQALAARCADPGALPARLAAARRSATIRRGAPSDALSERELTVLRYLAGGLTERQVAAELYLSFNTVHSHVKAIYRKLGVSSRAEAVAIHLGR
ncbi:LuxR family transcriptional regulator [Solirubrobacter soli]|uniref:LuxR family transcriptional regulator n=1 Tax=Solirubrobacter soli TaxID=363832 RepID=UPI0003FCA7B1|nr:LuxR family transcriptional regulator [Solirubrobacter soli]